jgi:hypothetical protein
MTLDCRNDCVEPLRFPKRPNNRPGLRHIDYRIGTYSDFREAMLRALDKDQVLEAWTHRTPDDPGIAILESAAILGDILTFYQELYANEAYLSTAVQRDSISDLVRLLGYRLAPGLGGTGTFAFGVKSPTPNAQSLTPITIPAGFVVKAQVGTSTKPLDFQTSEEITAYPFLSRFTLYRRRNAPGPITAGLNTLEIQDVGGAADVESIGALNLQKGDRLMIVPDASMFDVPGAGFTSQQNAEMLIVSKVEKVLDRTIVHFEGKLSQNWPTFVTAYKLGRTFKHFGHSAPNKLTKLSGSSAVQTDTSYFRPIADFTPSGTDAAFYPTLAATDLPLDQAVNDLAGGASVIVEALTFIVFFLFAFPIPAVVVKTIQSSSGDSITWGNLTGATTVLHLDSKLVLNDSLGDVGSDIRKFRIHETKSPPITLRAPSAWPGAAVTDGNLAFYGTYDQAVALAERKVMLVGPDGVSQEQSIATKATDLSLAGKDTIHPWLWPVTLNKKPDKLQRADFDEAKPGVVFYGNLADATQGKPERDAILGNGDSRQTFQTFKLPKAPVTYLESPGSTPPEAPELQIYVGNKQWKRVPSLFGHKPEEEIYIVREDADNNSWAQFGDGKTGARLPSGVDNILAKYRTGTGAFGPLKEETTVQLAGRVPRLEKGWLPGIISGGADPESGDNAREAAPAKVQSLDRLVSLRDIEAETLAIAGVDKASARWDLTDNIPTIQVIVLMETGREGELKSVQDILTASNRCRGPQRFPIVALKGSRQFIYIDLQFAPMPGWLQDPVREAIKAAIGESGETGIDGSHGLLGIHDRRFSEPEYATRIEGIVQDVESVSWCRVTGLGFVIPDPADPTNPDPATMTVPDLRPPAVAKVPCGPTQILALYKAHLTLNLVAAPQEGC